MVPEFGFKFYDAVSGGQSWKLQWSCTVSFFTFIELPKSSLVEEVTDKV